MIYQYLLKSKAGWSTIQIGLLQKFFHQYNLEWVKKNSDADLNIGKWRPHFQIIKENNLLEEFKNFNY